MTENTPQLAGLVSPPEWPGSFFDPHFWWVSFIGFVVVALFVGFHVARLVISSRLRKLDIGKRLRAYFSDDFSKKNRCHRLLKEAYEEQVRINQENEVEQDFENGLNPTDVEVPPQFDPETSVLVVSGTKMLINRRGRINNAHKILCHIFKSPNEQHFYAEIAEVEFGDGMVYKERGDKLWKTYYRACCDINNRIAVETGVQDFLITTTDRSGSVTINKKYLIG